MVQYTKQLSILYPQGSKSSQPIHLALMVLKTWSFQLGWLCTLMSSILVQTWK